MSALEWAEFAAAVVTALGLPVALVSFGARKRSELRMQRQEAANAQRRHDEMTFDRLHDDYVDFLKLQLAHPELDLGEEPLADPPQLSEIQRSQQVALFNVLISLVEKAHRLYAGTSDRSRINEWQGWEQYIDELLSRPHCQAMWDRHSSQYDASFVSTIDRRRARRRDALVEHLVVERVDSSDPRAVAFVEEASREPAAYLNTYLPRSASAEDAREWLRAMGPHTFLVRLSDAPVGLLTASTPRSPGVPPGFLETNTYIRPEYRGLRLAGVGWDQAEALIDPPPPGLAGVVWERNHAAAKRLARSGFRLRDRVYFTDPGTDSASESGWCEVWTRELGRVGHPAGA